jgi:hypothetical protein
MKTEIEVLEKLNVEIGTQEQEGAGGFFDDLLAPFFAMRRANGQILDRAGFLAAVAPSGPRSTDVDDVTFVGDLRALVACHVELNGTIYHNLRLFIRSSRTERWQLLAWANEAAS